MIAFRLFAVVAAVLPPAKDAEVLTVDSCLRLLQQQRQRQQQQRQKQQQAGGLLAPAVRRRRKLRRLLRLLLRPFWGFAARARDLPAPATATNVVAAASPATASAPSAASPPIAISPTAAALRQRQQSAETAEGEDTGRIASSRPPCSSPTGSHTAASSHYGAQAAAGAAGTVGAAAAAAAAPPTSPLAMNRRPNGAEALSSSMNGCSSTGSCSSSNGSSSSLVCGDSSRLHSASAAATATATTGEMWDQEAEDTESLAAKELKIRMSSLKSTLPLTALWLGKEAPVASAAAAAVPAAVGAVAHAAATAALLGPCRW